MSLFGIGPVSMRTVWPHDRGPADVASDKRAENTPEEEARPSVASPGDEPPDNQAEGTDVVAPVATGRPANGVLRLLQEGHFKGVAALRLSINFHSELTAARAEAVKPVVGEKAAAVVDAVNGYLEPVLSASELSEETLTALQGLTDTFSASVGGLIAEFMSTDSGDVEALASAVQAAFDELMASLHSLLGVDAEAGVENDGVQPADPAPDTAVPDAPAQVGDTPVTLDVEPEGAEGTDFEALIEGLVDVFTTALEDLEQSTSALASLPAPAPPNGNGVAYWKFLAVYRQLNGLADGDQSPPPDILDTVG